MDQARTRVSSTREALEQMFGPTGPSAAVRADASDDKLERIVDLHFEPYRRLAQSEGQGSPPAIAATPGLINELYTRSEERRVGNECARTCRSRWSPYR